MRRVAERLGQVSSPVAAAVALVPDAVLQGAAAVEPPDDDDDDDDDVVIEIVYPTAGPGDGAGGTAPEASLRDDAEQARVERE
jgi:hypothetical protein